MQRLLVLPEFLFGPILISIALLIASSNAIAAVFETTPTDVTTRAFSVVWVSDEPVTSATIKVYSDINGLVDITSTLSITTNSSSFPPAHAQGIVKVTATGLSSGTSYFVQSETVSTSGIFQYPATAPLLEIHTATEATKISTTNQPITNDLLINQITYPDGVTPAPGTLLLMEVEGLSAYPLTAFVGEGGFVAPQVVIDTNNFYGTDGRSLELQTDDVLKVTALRGLICGTEFTKQKLTGYLRTPEHLESPAITELESPAKCHSTDTVCDNVINVLDVQFVLNHVDKDVGACGFNPSADVIVDSKINVLDVQAILSSIGSTVPNR